MDAAISGSELLSAIREGRSPLIIDVRRKPAFQSATEMIAGVLRRDPERIADWAGELPRASRGLAAISLGLSRNFADDHEMLKHGMVVYDALYAWCKGGQEEIHTWNPAAYR